MFGCFFPSPRAFGISAVAWAFVALLFWFFVAADWGDPTGLSGLVGAEERTVWVYLYSFLAYAAFALFWMRFRPHKWSRWSVAGSALIVFVTWFQVQLDVMINEWFRTFYDIIQKALAEPGAVTVEDYYAQLATFLIIAMVFITTAVLNAFFTSHFVFRWRTAMNDRYVRLWQQVRHIEGASQRVQEDAMRFAGIMESLGTRFIDAVMTLIAFLPILWGLSSHIKENPRLRRGRVRAGLESPLAGRCSAPASWRWPATAFPGSSSATSGSRPPSARNSSWVRTGRTGLSRRRSASCSRMSGGTISASTSTISISTSSATAISRQA